MRRDGYVLNYNDVTMTASTTAVLTVGSVASLPALVDVKLPTPAGGAPNYKELICDRLPKGGVVRRGRCRHRHRRAHHRVFAPNRGDHHSVGFTVGVRVASRRHGSLASSVERTVRWLPHPLLGPQHDRGGGLRGSASRQDGHEVGKEDRPAGDDEEHRDRRDGLRNDADASCEVQPQLPSDDDPDRDANDDANDRVCSGHPGNAAEELSA